MSHVWGRNDGCTDITVRKDLDSLSVFSFIPVPQVYRHSKDYIVSMLAHIYELKRYSERYTRNQYITCKLCNIQIETASDLRLHLLSKLHKDLEQDLKSII